MNKIIIPTILLISVIGFSQNTYHTNFNPSVFNKVSVLDSIKNTFVKNNNLSTIDSLWMRELSNDELSKIQFDAVNNFNPETPVDFEFSTELFKERLKKLDNKSPFNIEYNVGLENIVKGFLKNRKKSNDRLWAISKYYFPIFEDALAKYNIPLEIKYLAIVESALNPKAQSKVGASGIWQFMYGTGLNYNLEVNSYIDERYDPLKATEAACKYLSGMYNIFQDWDLVLASYNCGPGNVTKAIRRSGGQKNYWNIRKKLPQETAGYLPLFLATMYIFEYHKEHGITDLKAPANYFKTDTILVKNQLSFNQISKLIDIPVTELSFLNPSYKLNIIPVINNKKNYLRLPVDKIALFTSNEDKIYYYVSYEDRLRERPILENFNKAKYATNYKYYRVKKGDKLLEIANKFDVSVNEIKRLNNLHGNIISKNKNLKIGFKQKIKVEAIAKISKPEVNLKVDSEIVEKQVNNSSDITPEITYTDEKIISFQKTIKNYKVHKGERLSDIASKFEVTTTEVKKWNNLKKNNINGRKIIKIIKNERVVKTIRKKEIKPLEIKSEIPNTYVSDLPITTNEELNIDKKEKLEIPNILLHIVSEEDKFFTICEKYHITANQLKSWNSLKDYKLEPGMKLIISSPQTEDITNQLEDNKKLHLVKRGDTIFSVSKKYQVSMADVKRWNGIQNIKLKPGMKLRIRV